MSKVEVNHLTKSFGSLKVLDDISFQVNDGDFLCIVGPTGCGKTTFLNSLVKLYDIDDGEILINGEEVDLNKHSIAYIMQEYSTDGKGKCAVWHEGKEIFQRETEQKN